jgi:hypothetical protein
MAKVVQAARLGALAVGALSLALAACSTTRAQLEKNPKGISTSSLCRTILESQDPILRREIAGELSSRGVTYFECPTMVQKEDQAAVAFAAVALAGAAIAVCASGGCRGGGYYSPPRSYRGNCQYDWQYDAAGNRCGRRSAWSRPGGY